MEEGVCDDDNALHISSDDPFVNIPVKKLCGTVNKVEQFNYFFPLFSVVYKWVLYLYFFILVYSQGSQIYFVYALLPTSRFAASL